MKEFCTTHSPPMVFNDWTKTSTMKQQPIVVPFEKLSRNGGRTGKRWEVELPPASIEFDGRRTDKSCHLIRTYSVFSYRTSADGVLGYILAYHLSAYHEQDQRSNNWMLNIIVWVNKLGDSTNQIDQVQNLIVQCPKPVVIKNPSLT